MKLFASDIIDLESDKLNLSKNQILDLEKSLAAFQNLEGKDWQVSFSVYNNEARNFARELDEMQPIFVLSVDTENAANGNKVDGYQKNDFDEMEKLDQKVDDIIASENTLFRVGVEIKPLDYNNGSDDSSGGSGNNSGSGGSNDGNIGGLNGTGAGQIVVPGSGTPALPISGLSIQYMECKLKKESSFESNDVNIIGYKENIFNQISGDCGTKMACSPTYCTDDTGKNINHFTNSNVNNHDTIFTNFRVDFYSVTYERLIFFVIFEHDNWPAPGRIKTFQLPNGTLRNIYYRSYENPYDTPLLYLSSNFESNPTTYPLANNYIHDDSWMRYEMAYTQ